MLPRSTSIPTYTKVHPRNNTHVTSFGFVKLFLMSVLQHVVHHLAALPHIKQRLPMLVADLLQPQRWTVKAHEDTNGVLGKRGYVQRSRQTCQSLMCRTGRCVVGYIRSIHSLWPTPAAGRSRRRQAWFGSLPCSGPEGLSRVVSGQSVIRVGCLWMSLKRSFTVMMVAPWLFQTEGWIASTTATSRSESHHSWLGWFRLGFQRQLQSRPWHPWSEPRQLDTTRQQRRWCFLT